MYTEIDRCRISGSTNLVNVLSLGEQALTGVFPNTKEEIVTRGPLDLVWCPDSGLLQLKQSYSLDEMYGDNYGYRSGLNLSMVDHLTKKIKKLESIVTLSDSDLVIDIGSNDATSLKVYSGKHRKVGIDPTGKKFKQFYTHGIELIPDFFSASVFSAHFPGSQARIVTSIAMFYDLPDPAAFVRDIQSVLAADGIWHFEQSYLPMMLTANAYDTICHEHLEFYSLFVVKNLLEQCGLRIMDVEKNFINGGSFAITACHQKAKYISNEAVIDQMLAEEEAMGLETIKPYADFEQKVKAHKTDLRKRISDLRKQGKRIFGYGASTKGNVLLQYCEFGVEEIECIAEVNEQKFGHFTPGTHIPIVSEEEARKMKPDYFLVLPWHFKESILAREQKFIQDGGKFIFPLPEISVY